MYDGVSFIDITKEDEINDEELYNTVNDYYDLSSKILVVDYFKEEE